MIPERFNSHVYALMRIVFGFLFMTHGLQKFGVLGGEMVPLFSWPIGVAAVLELVLGALITIGLLARPAAFVAAGEMAVAYLWAHQPRGVLPLQNGGEPAVLFCFAFLLIAVRGAGIWSADASRGVSARA